MKNLTIPSPQKSHDRVTTDKNDFWGILGAAGISVAAAAFGLVARHRARTHQTVEKTSQGTPKDHFEGDTDIKTSQSHDQTKPHVSGYRYAIGYRSLGHNATRARHVNYQSPSIDPSTLPSGHAPPPLSLALNEANEDNLSYEAAHERLLQDFELQREKQSQSDPAPAPSPLRFDDTPGVLRFVLTGGPCAGKTTALARLSSFLRHRGYRVYTVPEVRDCFACGPVCFFPRSQSSEINSAGGDYAFHEWRIVS